MYTRYVRTRISSCTRACECTVLWIRRSSATAGFHIPNAVTDGRRQNKKKQNKNKKALDFRARSSYRFHSYRARIYTTTIHHTRATARTTSAVYNTTQPRRRHRPSPSLKSPNLRSRSISRTIYFSVSCTVLTHAHTRAHTRSLT